MRWIAVLVLAASMLSIANPALAEHGGCHPVGYCENGRLPFWNMVCNYEWVWDDYYQGWWFHNIGGMACPSEDVGWYWWGT